MQVMHGERAVHEPAAPLLFFRQLLKTVPDLLVKMRRLALDPVERTCRRVLFCRRRGALETGRDIDVENECQVRHDPLRRDLVCLPDKILVDPPAGALIDQRRVCEPVADDDPAVFKMRPHDRLDVLVVDAPDRVRRQAVPLGPGSTPAMVIVGVMVVLLATGSVPP